MNANYHKTERLHSLDSLRAIMMMLGLVIHSAITYAVFDFGNAWSLKDPGATHWTNDYIVFFIHSFRMQIFFFVAGFFGALIFYERGMKRMLKNRLDRIFYPLCVFVVLLWPTIIFSFNYSGNIFGGNPEAWSNSVGLLKQVGTYMPNGTFHLWFLYYLVLLTATGVLLALVMNKLPLVSGKLNDWHHAIIKHPILRVLVFAAVSALVYVFMGTAQVATSTSWVPDLNTFVYYLVFYLAGWVLFKSKHHLGELMRMDWACTILGIVLFSANFFMHGKIGYANTIILLSVMTWCLIYGITGLFIRYASNHSPVMRYISDASYWVFLIHLSFTAIIPGLISEWAISPTLKFMFVMTVTTIICFVTYHFFVRTTFIGKFLNGRRYTRKIADIAENHNANENENANVSEPKASH